MEKQATIKSTIFISDEQFEPKHTDSSFFNVNYFCQT